ncbi:MAG: hypothetical protein NTW25_15910 [Candidatus Kapabacteria bacterium]|nr:hypothetical protein [Candidatus Kapabacteria bacterium]
MNFFKTILIIIFISFQQIYTQDKYVSFELAGSGGLASVNYEKQIFKLDNNNINYRLGFSFAPIDANNGYILIFPIMLQYVYGNSNNKADFGIGQTFSITTKGNFFIMMPLSLGYRYEPNDKDYYWRFSYTPIVSYLFGFQYQNWAGITYGLKL